MDANAQQLEGIDEHQHVRPEMQDSRFDGADPAEQQMPGPEPSTQTSLEKRVAREGPGFCLAQAYRAPSTISLIQVSNRAL